MSDLGVWESVLGSSSEVWVRSPAEMRFGAVLTSKCGCWSYFVFPNSGAALYAVAPPLDSAPMRVYDEGTATCTENPAVRKWLNT